MAKILARLRPSGPTRAHEESDQAWLQGEGHWVLVAGALRPARQAQQILQVLTRQGWLQGPTTLPAGALRSMAWIHREVRQNASAVEYTSLPYAAGLVPIVRAVCRARLCQGLTETHFPWAALAALADGLRPQEHQTVIALSPARLGLGTQQVELQTQGIGLDASHRPALEDLASAMNSELALGRSGQLYLLAKDPLDLVSCMPDLLAGEHLPDFEPSGRDASLWRQAVNVLQMSLFEASQDDPQQAQTVWPWGIGSLPAVMPAVLPPPTEAPQTGPLALRGLQEWLASLGYSPRLSLQSPPVLQDLWQETSVVQWSHDWASLMTQWDEAQVDRLLLADRWWCRSIGRTKHQWSWRRLTQARPWPSRRRPARELVEVLLQCLSFDEDLVP